MSKGHDRGCRELVEQLSRFIDGDLSVADRREVAAHLRHCPCCDDFVESLRRTVELCHEAGRTNLPPAVRARARARIRVLLGRVQAAGGKGTADSGQRSGGSKRVLSRRDLRSC